MREREKVKEQGLGEVVVERRVDVSCTFACIHLVVSWMKKTFGTS